MTGFVDGQTLTAQQLEDRFNQYLATGTLSSAILAFLASTNVPGALNSLGVAALADPTFTGVPKAPTASTSDNSTQLATTAYVKACIAAIVSGMTFQGVINASTNPNYPAGTKGDVYRISVAGKIGGASGINVENGDMLFCQTTGAAGNQATVGSNWDIVQANIDGAVTTTSLATTLASYAILGANTFPGNQTISPASGDVILGLNKPSATQYNIIRGYKANSIRWDLVLGNNAAESGSNAGSDFGLNRFDDSGSYLGSPFLISRADGGIYTGGVTGGSKGADSINLKKLFMDGIQAVPVLASGSFYWNGSSVVTAGLFNVSSIVRNSTGNFTITFASALPSVNYNVAGQLTGIGVLSIYSSGLGAAPTLKTTSQVTIVTGYPGVSANDPTAAGGCTFSVIGG